MGAQQQQPGLRGVLRHVAEQLQGRRACPVQVLQDAHHRADLADGSQQVGDRVEQLPAVVAVVARRGLQIRAVPPYQRRQPQQLTRRAAQVLGQDTLGGPAQQLLQALDEGLVSRAGLRGAGTDQHHRSPAMQSRG